MINNLPLSEQNQLICHSSWGCYDMEKSPLLTPLSKWESQLLSAIDPDACNHVIGSLDNPAEHLAVKLDVSQKASVEETIKSILEKYSRYELRQKI